ncbi:MAG TPA: DUF2442 domain-containing protein [Terracidiphilus sp.]|nr:DUF2442 domain-containing protein [Terracidiphilus sp.]
MTPFKEAGQKATQMRSSAPRAIGARYDKRTGRIVVQLSTKLDIAFDPRDAQGLESARASQLEPIEISPSGFGMYFPKLDADLYIPALLEGFLGSKAWMASRLGQSGGKAKSVAKASAARQNGRLGGRPRKKVSAVA